VKRPSWVASAPPGSIRSQAGLVQGGFRHEPGVAFRYGETRRTRKGASSLSLVRNESRRTLRASDFGARPFFASGKPASRLWGLGKIPRGPGSRAQALGSRHEGGFLGHFTSARTAKFLGRRGPRQKRPPPIAFLRLRRPMPLGPPMSPDAGADQHRHAQGWFTEGTRRDPGPPDRKITGSGARRPRKREAPVVFVNYEVFGGPRVGEGTILSAGWPKVRLMLASGGLLSFRPRRGSLEGTTIPRW